MESEKIIYKELSYKIIECCFEVHKILGPGFSEKIYEEALAIEFNNRNIVHERQKVINVMYKEHLIGEYRLDLVVEDKIIIELKATTNLNEIFEMQLLSYLKATGMKLGLLINFGEKSLKNKRIVN